MYNAGVTPLHDPSALLMTRRITCKKQAKRGLAAIAEPRRFVRFPNKAACPPLYTTFLIGTIIETGNGGCLSCSQIVSERLRFHSGARWVKKFVQPTYSFAIKRRGRVQQSRGGGRYTAPVKLCRSNARQSFLKVWLEVAKAGKKALAHWVVNSSRREKYRLNELNYKIYRASKGAVSFWRWEVFHKNCRAVPPKIRIHIRQLAATLKSEHRMQCRNWPMLERLESKKNPPPGEGL